MNIEPRWATTRHPQTNRQTERAIQQLIQMILVSSRNNLSLLKSLPALEYATNNTHKETLGTTPFKVCLNYNPQNPQYANGSELPPANQSQIRERLETKGKAVSDHINNSRKEMIGPKVGDMVYVRTKSIRAPHLLTKLSPQFMGPYEITSKIGEKNYALNLPPELNRTHNNFNLKNIKHWSKERNTGLEGENVNDSHSNINH
jgi:hypothetical protein